MNKNTFLLVFAALIAGLSFNSFFIVNEKENAIVFQFGEAVRTDISVGQLITLVLPDAAANTTEESRFHSGDHLITNVQCTFNSNILNTNIICIKDSYENSLELSEVNYEMGDSELPNREQRNSE